MKNQEAIEILRKLEAWGIQSMQLRMIEGLLMAALAREKGKAKEQAKMLTYCAYCGYEVSIDADGSIIAEHIRTCDKHPMQTAIKVAVAEEREACVTLANDDAENGLSAMIGNRIANKIRARGY